AGNEGYLGVSQGKRDSIYCIDTSSLVNLRKWRPGRQHAESWQCLEELIEADRLIAPKAILEELEQLDDTLLKWVRKHKRMFRRTSRELVGRAQEILQRFPNLVDPDQPRASADPFVVALAIQERSSELYAPELFVVTEEKYAPGRPRIPHVCEAYQIKYLTIHQMFLFEGWTL